jgi:iron complex outermembrane receptor protein
VLVLQDGLRVFGIASQSADEVEPIDVLSLDRVEIVKGPATLLYGSNAIGGVVNGISTNDVHQRGLSGYLNAFGGTNNWQTGRSVVSNSDSGISSFLPTAERKKRTTIAVPSEQF